MVEDVIKNTEQASLMEQILYEVKKVIVGQDHLLERVLVALLSQGHVLVEGVPGLAKTLTVKTLAQAVHGTFRRIQFTPDLVPADLVGTRMYNQKTCDFSTSLGPVFTNLLLADEINRAPAKVQSALLEVMQERQVTIGGQTYKVPEPFLVMATQNPIELEGTFPLPEAQLDRFLLKIKMGYPAMADDRLILERFRMDNPLDGLTEVVTASELLQIQVACREVNVTGDMEDYIIKLIHSTRNHALLELGASPRAMLDLYHASQALAALRGRTFVIPDDVKYLAGFVLSHRIILKTESHLRGNNTGQALKEIIDTVPVPVEDEVGTEEK